MRTHLTIGELAKLLEINNSKIRYYEKKGLLEPSMIDDNGYALYSLEDLEKLEIILLFRRMDVPIEKVKEFMDGYDREDYMDLLIQIETDTKRQIKELKMKEKEIKYRIKHLQEYEKNSVKKIHFPEVVTYIIDESGEQAISPKDFYEIHNKFNILITNYEDRYFFFFDEDHVRIGVETKNKLVKVQPKRVIPEGDYIQIHLELSEDLRTDEVNSKIDQLLELNGYQRVGNIIGVEDFRQFLYSNIKRNHTYIVKVK